MTFVPIGNASLSYAMSGFDLSPHPYYAAKRCTVCQKHTKYADAA